MGGLSSESLRPNSCEAQSASPPGHGEDLPLVVQKVRVSTQRRQSAEAAVLIANAGRKEALPSLAREGPRSLFLRDNRAAIEHHEQHSALRVSGMDGAGRN